MPFMASDGEIYETTVELPGVGKVAVTAKVFRGYQGARVIRQTILSGRYADGTEITANDRARAHELLPDVE